MSTCETCRWWSEHENGDAKDRWGFCGSGDDRLQDIFDVRSDFGCPVHEPEDEPEQTFTSEPTGRIRMLWAPSGGRLQTEWTTWFGGTVWMDVPNVRVDDLPPRG